MYSCTKCGKQCEVVYNIRYGMWGVDRWMCRFCATRAWNEIGGSPAATIHALFQGQERVEYIGELNGLPANDMEEAALFGLGRRQPPVAIDGSCMVIEAC